MQATPRIQAFYDTFGQSYGVAPSPPAQAPFESPLPDEAAVRRAYGAGVGLPSDRWKLDLQAQLVGAVIFVLAGICLLATVVLILGAWLPAWLVTLGLSCALTALGLALFASVSRPRNRQANAFPTEAASAAPSEHPAPFEEAIEEIDPKEVESVRGPELASDWFDQPRLPHPIVAAVAVDNDTDSDPDVDDAKTRPLGERPPAPPSRKPLRAEMRSGASLNGLS